MNTDVEQLWPLMACVVCGHRQTFDARKVVGRAEGICDHCGVVRQWEDCNPKKAEA